MREVTDLPLAVGFGISTPEQVAEVGALADGVVVGSAIVKAIEAAGTGPDLEAQVQAFVRSLARGRVRGVWQP
jgi:tryptophan synthase alpha chain